LSIKTRLILEIDALDAIADTREYLVRDGVEGIAQNGNRQVLAKNLYLISLMTWDIGDIDHGHVHTDIAYIFGFLTIYQTIAMTIAKVTVQTISIADRNSGNHTIALYLTFTAVAYCLTSWHMAHLKNGGLQRRYGMQDTVIARIDAIKAEA
jgi:hypothetical protein